MQCGHPHSHQQVPFALGLIARPAWMRPNWSWVAILESIYPIHLPRVSYLWNLYYFLNRHYVFLHIFVHHFCPIFTSLKSEQVFFFCNFENRCQTKKDKKTGPLFFLFYFILFWIYRRRMTHKFPKQGLFPLWPFQGWKLILFLCTKK